MRAFVAVATRGSFAEAARHLRLSHSVVSRAIAGLEDRLGLVLLMRTTRSVRLTERGAIYVESCRKILEDIDGAERLVRGEDAAPRGILTVAAPILFGRLHVLPILTGLMAGHADLRVRLALSDRNVHLVEEGVDVAIRVGALADSSLAAVRLGAVSRVIVASPAYLVRREHPRGPADLDDHDIVAFEGVGLDDIWRFAKPDLDVRIEPRIAVNSADAAIAAAEQGVGITRAFSYQIQSKVAAGRLVPLLRGFEAPPLPVSAVHQARRIGSANLEAFKAAARTYFKGRDLTLA